MWEPFCLQPEVLIQQLKQPEGLIDVVVDTDTYNEIDDQFALAYLLKSSNRLKVQAIYAAPFTNERAATPQIGMEKSYQEILKLLELMGEEDKTQITLKGATTYLPNEKEAVVSAAARDLATRGMAYSQKKPLYVVALATLTNVSSAILLNPELVNRLVVVWLGGHAFDWHDNREFNLRQDLAAAKVLLDCGVPVILLPCNGVVSAFTTTGPELEYWLKGKNALCDYLVESTVLEGEKHKSASTWSRPIWDVAAVAWLLDERFMLERFESSPLVTANGTWRFDRRRHFLKYVYHIRRDLVFEDLVKKLTS